MATITLRSIKGSPLTIAEVDDNFSNLNIEVGQKLNSSAYTAADVLSKLLTVDSDTSGLNATTLKSMEPSASNVASSIVMRNTLGSFSANEITANAFIGNVTGNASGTALNVTGTVAVINGGTGANSPSAALDNLLPSGEVPGYVLKTSGPGTYFWSAETGATTIFGTRIDTSRTTYTATAGQTVFTGTGTYTIGSGQLRVYINGVRQFPDAYTETSTSSFTLTNGVAAGTKVMAEVDANASYTVLANTVTFSPVGNLSSTNVQNAIAELDSEKAAVGQQFFLGTTQVAINRTSGALTLSGVTVDNLAGGGAGQIPYQTASGTTAFTAAGGVGQVLTAQGTSAPIWVTPSTYSGSSMQVITSTSDWTVPTGITRCVVEVIGGGGGGNRNGGGAGGGGGYVVAQITGLTPGQIITCTIGSGGSGQTFSGSFSGAGTASSFGSYVSAAGGGATNGSGSPGVSGTGTVTSGTAIRITSVWPSGYNPTNFASSGLGAYVSPYTKGVVNESSTQSPTPYSVSSPFSAGMPGGSNVGSGGIGGAIIIHY